MTAKLKLQLFLPAVVFIILFIINLPFANQQLMSADGSLYLNIGKNLFSGKGFSLSYNLYQFWPGKYYPALSYTHPLFCIIAGLLYTLFNLKAVIIFNIFLLAINGALLYKILLFKLNWQKSLLFSAIISFSKTLIFCAIFPWTEQLHLCFLLLTIFLYLKYENIDYLIGILLATSILIRVPAFFGVAAFGLALIMQHGFSKNAFKKYFKIIMGFTAIILSYQIICYLSVGKFFPEHYLANPSKTFLYAELFPGASFQNSFPVLQTNFFEPDFSTKINHFIQQIIGFIKSFRILCFAFLLVPVYSIYAWLKKKDTLVLIFFFLGLFFILGHSLRFTFYYNEMFGTLRYSVIIFVTWGSLGLIALDQLINKLSKQRKNFTVFAYFLFLLIFSFEIKSYTALRTYYLSTYANAYKALTNSRTEICNWIEKNTNPEDLIASDFIQDAIFLNRPFVSVPQGKARTSNNFFNFIFIYKPQYLLTYDPNLVRFLKQIGFETIKQANSLFLLHSTKNLEIKKNATTAKPKEKQAQNEGSW